MEFYLQYWFDQHSSECTWSIELALNVSRSCVEVSFPPPCLVHNSSMPLGARCRWLTIHSLLVSTPTLLERYFPLCLPSLIPSNDYRILAKEKTWIAELTSDWVAAEMAETAEVLMILYIRWWIRGTHLFWGKFRGDQFLVLVEWNLWRSGCPRREHRISTHFTVMSPQLGRMLEHFYAKFHRLRLRTVWTPKP